MTHLRIKNWGKYQHYKDRNPPWVKLYLNIVVKYHADGTHNHVRTLSDPAWRLYLSMFCLAPRFDGYIPNDPEYITAETGADAGQLSALLQAGLILECSKPASDDASKRASKVAPVLLDSENREERRETEAETETECSVLPVIQNDKQANTSSDLQPEWQGLVDPVTVATFFRATTTADPTPAMLACWRAAMVDLASRNANPAAIGEALEAYEHADPKFRPRIPDARFLNAEWFLGLVTKLDRTAQ